VLDGALLLETRLGADILYAGDAVFENGRTAYRLVAGSHAQVAVADLRLVVPPSRIPNPLVVRDFMRRHSGVAELVRRCPLGSECSPSVFAASYGGLIGASMMNSWQEEHRGSDDRDSVATDPAVSAVVSALADRPADAWTVDRMARSVHLSRSALTERFRRTLGVSPLRVLREIRMQQARELLADRSRSVQQVGHAVGYGSTAAFSRAFSVHHGSPPQTWRETSLVG
jgi:AraC-like DNA-binding protein